MEKGLYLVLGTKKPTLREVWEIYFGEKSPVMKLLMDTMGIDYEICLRLLSTTAVLQGNKWSISDYASEYNVCSYNKLKVRKQYKIEY